MRIFGVHTFVCLRRNTTRVWMAVVILVALGGISAIHFLAQPRIEPLVKPDTQHLLEIHSLKTEREIQNAKMTTAYAPLHDRKSAHRKTLNPRLNPKGQRPFRSRETVLRSGELLVHQSNINHHPNITQSYLGEILVLPPQHITNQVTTHGSGKCLNEGTERFQSGSTCECRSGWSGRHCSIPNLVTTSQAYKDNKESFTFRSKARRVIYTLPFSAEFEMLEAHLYELADLVDVFIIIESNYTFYGLGKPLRLLDRLYQGKYVEISAKIVHVFLDHFLDAAYTNSFIMETYTKNYLSVHGLNSIRGMHGDDLFILSDSDELISREALSFLKHHNNFREPVVLNLQWSAFGFFYRNPRLIAINGACTIEMMSEVFANKASLLESETMDTETSKRLNGYYGKRKQRGEHRFIVGNTNYPAGWHCSWCTDIDGAITKLMSAGEADFPRWGDFPEKRTRGYIENMIRTGIWFDGRSSLGKQTDRKTDTFFAPAFVLAHPKKYRHLLELIY